MVLQDSIPKQTRSAILTSLERITQPITDFIRGNPIVSTAAIGIGTTGLITGIAAVRRVGKKKKRKVSKKRRVVKKKGKKTVRKVAKRKKVTHRSPRHKGHKRVSFTTAGGKKVSFLVKKKAHTHRRRRSSHK